MSYVSLHNHSHYSLLDGLTSPDLMAKTVSELGQPAVALTDHGTLSGHREMQRACAEHEVKFIAGGEFYISPTDRFDRRSKKSREDGTQVYHHIILLAKNDNGLRNLHAMSRIAWTEGFYHSPRIDMELLEQYGEDIIVLSGCMSGLIAKAIEKEDMAEAHRWTARLHGLFGDDFYIEVQPHNPEGLNKALIDIADEHGIRPVATTDSHFDRPENRWVEEAMLVLATRPKPNRKYDAIADMDDVFERLDTLYPGRTMSFKDIDVYMMARDEFPKDFVDLVGERALDVTVEIADEVEDYTYHEDLDLLPSITDNPNETLRQGVRDGLTRLGLTNNEYQQRAKYEIEIIESKNFSNYFLMVQDIVDWCRQQDIPVGKGRGSAASSLVCYALGITGVDPLKYNLLFTRFLDPSRPDWPDIDLDISRRERPRVYDYLRRQYGHVASISNIVYLNEKNAIKDAASVYRVPFSVVNKALSKVETWNQFMNTSDPAAVAFRTNYPDVMELAEQFRGTIRNHSIHAAGVVVSNRPIEEIAPIETRSSSDDSKDGRIPVVAWDMYECESVGFVKFDLLGLKTLDVIKDALGFIDKDIDIDALSMDDPKVFEQINSGNTLGGFQIEGGPYQGLLEEMKVRDFNELVASNALVRPGARDTIGDSYISRQRGEEPVEPIHASVAKYMEDTYQHPIYQEQIMQIAQELGGMSGVESNEMRRIMAKKKDPELLEPYRDKFVSNATPKLGTAKAANLWSMMEAQTEYSFNLAHAVAYSMLTYQTMWLKTYYPLEFMTALYRNETKQDKRTYILLEMRRMGLSVQLPEINKSESVATVKDDSMLMGLSEPKWLSELVYNNIKKHRPYKSFDELKQTAEQKYSGINSRAVDVLVETEAFRNMPDAPDHEGGMLYEYLGIPKFKNYNIDGVGKHAFTDLEFVDEQDAFVVRAMVTDVTTGVSDSGYEWTRVEFVDETSSGSRFLSTDQEVETGQMYVMVLGGNSILKAVPIDDVHDDDALMAYLTNKFTGYMVIAMSERTTKRGSTMADLVIGRGRTLYKCLIFPGPYGKMGSKVFEGAGFTDVRMSKLDDGTNNIFGVEN